MERCSFFIPDKALFGSFPTQTEVCFLESIGVRYFVDLTLENEPKTVPYITRFKYLKHPITDRQIPKNWNDFSVFIVGLSHIISSLKEKDKIYIHCRGGHGRSGIVVASVLCYLNDMSPEDALMYTSECYSKRPNIKEKYLKHGSPQHNFQKNFVRKFFKYLKFNRKSDIGFTNDFSLYSKFNIITELGVFDTAISAFKAYCKLDPNISDERKVELMFRILLLKFQQNESLKEKLLMTGLRPLINVSFNIFWGTNNNQQGLNHVGRILEKIRDDYLYSIFLNSGANTGLSKCECLNAT